MPALLALRKILTLRCREAAELMSTSQDQELGFGDRWALRLHLMICTACRRYRRQVRMLRRMLADLGRRLAEGDAEVALSEDARRRLRAAVEAERD